MTGNQSILLTLLILPLTFSCKKTSSQDYNQKAANPIYIHTCTDQLTDIIVFDIFKPPVASRIYAYSYLAAYETLINQNPDYKSLSGKINDFNNVPKPEKGKEYCYPLASVKAFITVASMLTFSKDKWDVFENKFYKKYDSMDIPEDVYNRSIEFGEKIGKYVLEYSGKDNYKTTRGYRHTLQHSEGSWEPTPPNYVEACEPRWNTIRSFTLDSASQFAAPVPAKYSTDTTSEFYKLVKEVYDLSKSKTEEQEKIAYFWDDNAFVTNITGHVSYAEKKMTPPGHWIQITRSVCKNKKADMLQSLKAYTYTSIGMFDSFIACWDCKYKTDRIRPITVINRFMDQDWLPFLETPAFPEYISGHSALSASAGKILTNLFGQNYQFTDSTEFRYGHGVRSFDSFEQAYWETSMSRVYGGIHFRDGAEEGTRQGEKVGEWVLTKLTEGSPKKDIKIAKSELSSEHK